MGKAMLRQRFLGAIAVAITCLDAVLATASPPSISVLEQQALAEFSKAGDAVRERLAREAAGDLIGARIAARDGDTHRYRFLDIQRELRRLHSRAAPTPSVAASRSPFSPDPSFLVPSADGSAPKPERNEPLMGRVSRPLGTCIGRTSCRIHPVSVTGRDRTRNRRCRVPRDELGTCIPVVSLDAWLTKRWRRPMTGRGSFPRVRCHASRFWFIGHAVPVAKCANRRRRRSRGGCIGWLLG